jgi:hypothetical protein
MTMFKHSQAAGTSRLATHFLKHYTTYTTGIGKLLGDTTGDIVLAPEKTAEAAARAARLFAQALHEDSHYELDWLWYAANMAGDSQRRYCLERVLRINPDSELAQRALAKLAAQ